ncbi:hypothetical protein [Paenibacillus crassostreae]|uniref:DUF5668 domain-containing protein n=1 Tax=Paenibacillus crassostreae TaxID=1763538 RepID=A0A167C353_9BACL|nr:hypothetical protein [Paenibacillus crassostreae]AOZ91704.1 hypothetical protein LPB68_05365 [Paenibacillus crassostreae]OAB72724.1 hypothetical protein PNBC_14885 [Paenibacillus crassostreae]
MSSKKDMKLGLLIIVAGLVILLGNLGVFGFIGRFLWPLVILIAGLALHVLYFSRRSEPIFLIPAGILTVWGLLFTICNIWGWGLMAHIWPGLVLGIAIGLYEYYLYENLRSDTLLWVAISLGLLSVVLFFFSLFRTGGTYILALILIGCGAWLIWGRRGNKSKW